jgi:hypothetical protein
MRLIQRTDLLSRRALAVKDLLCTEDPHDVRQPRLGRVKSPYTASAVRYLEENGAIVIGKTNMDSLPWEVPRSSRPSALRRIPGTFRASPAAARRERAAVAAGYAYSAGSTGVD